MIYIISGTNRLNSRTRQVVSCISDHYKEIGQSTEVIDLAKLPFDQLNGGHYGGTLPAEFNTAIEKINSADGLVVVTPEYNGSMPGALKYFIDFWSYPKSFEYRPVAFVGLGFRWGGLRPVEHLQQVFNYRNAFIFPERVFLTQISDVLKDGKIVNAEIEGLMKKQATGFKKFIAGLKDQGLHPNYK